MAITVVSAIISAARWYLTHIVSILMVMMGSTSTNTKLRGDVTSFVLGRCTFTENLDIYQEIADLSWLNPQDTPFLDII